MQFLFKSGLLLGYRASESPGTILKSDQIRRPSTLTMQFVKVFVKKIESPAPEDGFLSASLIADRRSAPRTLIPFNTVYQKNRPLSGLFLTGDRPSWFIKLDKSDLLCLPCDYNVVYAMTPCSMWDSDANFLMNTEEVSFCGQCFYKSQLH
jgi:cleavage and polyadenylation specificity factor subunit 1